MPPVAKVLKNSKTLTFEKRYDEYNQTPTGKKFILYHTNWANYARDFQVNDLPIDHIPEISYAFFNLKENGNIFSGDTWADFEKRYVNPDNSVLPLDTWENNNQLVYGNLGQFYKLKQNGKKFNLTLSIGGWSWSKHFSSAVKKENRENFTNNIIGFFDKYPFFNGVSLDWEYCTNDGINYGAAGNNASKDDAQNFKAFCELLRSKLNATNKTHYKISVCCSANLKVAKLMSSSSLEPFVDEFHIMTYDFSGFPGEKITRHHTNLKKTSYSIFSVEEAVDFYLSEKIPSKKLFIGVAYYSRGFKDSEGPGLPGEGVSRDTSYEQGIVDYKDLPLPGAIEYWDPEALAPFSYDKQKKVFNSYDNVNSVFEKCKYVWERDLGGIIVWESSADNVNTRSLTEALYSYLINSDPNNTVPPPLPEIWKKPEEETTNPVPDIPAPILIKDWSKGISYEIGDKAKYKDFYYLCLVAHTSNISWPPDIATTLWGKIEDKESPKSPETPKEIPQETEENLNPEIPLCECMCKKIKSIRLTGDIDLSNIEFIYDSE